ncbi:Spy/CpxP family protein refolding chaperone [Aestuariibacter sp. A3R04]|uniref:Spy/CpxP family protein refolding chaperone n=1 Tax=Aestuariibacter sp. A3R04 TaxID=2841571 RepID=UPI001C0983E8|nr:Spy/CpxP family protein refolding chaperone [Aestuariibacter sp. A3R04]MBU3020816.1 Spy/CpxP family protein refolding chaperone [Aestuariibacter sp. A3R04]
MKKRLIASLIGGILLASPVFAKPGPNAPEGMVLMHTLQQLDLERDQKKALRQLVRAFHEEQSGNKDGARKGKRRGESKGNLTELSETEIAQQAAEKWAKTKAHRIALAELKHDAWQLLTDAQRVQLDEVMEERKADMQARIASKKEKGELPRPFSQLDLSEEQQTQIAEILASHKSQKEAERDDWESLREQEQAIIRQTAFDAEALSALLDSHKQQFVQRAIEKAQMHASILALLSEEQIEILQDRRPMHGPGKGRRYHS